MKSIKPNYTMRLVLFQSTVRKAFFLLSFLLFAGSLFSQDSYQKGYFITNNNERTVCLIENKDWDENPFYFNYKLSQDGEELKAGIDRILCFEIDTTHKYVRKEVNIDTSPSELGDYSYQKAPEFETKVLFLKVLIEGDCNLYSYKGDKLTRFFIQRKGEKTTQLIYKSYFAESSAVATNERFRGQLAAFMLCDEKLRFQIMNMSYTKRALIQLFKRYELCSNKSFKYYQAERKGHIKLNFNAGLGISSINSNSVTTVGNFTQNAILSYKVGTEVEYFFPIKNDKLSFLVEPLIQIERSEFQVKRFYSKYFLNMVSLPLGLRYYVYNNSNSGFFINSGLRFSYTLNSGIDFHNRTVDLEPGSLAYELEFSKLGWGVFSGIGYRFNDILVELRYNGVNQDLTRPEEYGKLKYNNFVLTASYSLGLGGK